MFGSADAGRFSRPIIRLARSGLLPGGQRVVGSNPAVPTTVDVNEEARAAMRGPFSFSEFLLPLRSQSMARRYRTDRLCV